MRASVRGACDVMAMRVVRSRLRSPVLWVVLAAAPASAQQRLTLPARDVLLQGTPTPVFSAGRAEGADWEMFSRVAALAFDAADNLYVVDGDNYRVVVLDARGRFVRQFGRQGNGPGEFQRPRHIAVLSSGEVVVTDTRNRTHQWFSSQGAFLRSSAYEQPAGSNMREMFVDAAGRIVALVETISGQRAATVSSQAADGRGSARIIANIVLDDMVQMGNVRRDREFARVPFLTRGPNGTLLLNRKLEYELEVVDSTGRLIRVISRDIPVRPVTTEVRAAWERRRNAEAQARGIPGAAPRVEVPFAERMQVISGMLADSRGIVWVQRRTVDGDAAGPIDLVTMEGRYVGTVAAQRLPMAVSRSGLTAYVERNADGVERVTVRRLPAGWR